VLLFDSTSQQAHSKRCASSEVPFPGSRQRMESGGLPPPWEPGNADHPIL